MKVVEYLTADRTSPFRDWFDGLDSRAAAKVTTVLLRMGMGNISNVESVGGGVYERKIDYGPGYRIYFGMDGEKLVVLIGGGIKKRQGQDIAMAGQRWMDYKKRKKQP